SGGPRGNVYPDQKTWAGGDAVGVADGRWERRRGGEVLEAGAFARGKRVGPWRVDDGFQLNEQASLWQAEGTFTDGVPTGTWALGWGTTVFGRGAAPGTYGEPLSVATDRWTGTFVDGAPATTRTLELADALAASEALPTGETVTLRVPVETIGSATIARASHVCDGPQLAWVYSLGEEAPIAVDPHPLFTEGWHASIVAAETASTGAGPDADFSRVQVGWDAPEATGTLELVAVLGAGATDDRSVRACFLEPRAVARVLAWRVCGATTCGPWTGFWDRAFTDPAPSTDPATTG
ncbi:MAG: hypothetical protein ACK4YP_05445, partial [Myxococcota bacterium]